MKPFFLSVVVALLVSPLFAQDAVAVKEKKTVDPTGTWRWESEGDSGKQEHELRIDADGKGSATVVYNGMIDDLKAKSATIKGDKMEIDFDVERDGNSFTANYDIVIDGDTAEGTLTLASDDGEMDIPWKATRTLELADLAGKWNLVVETDAEDHKGVLVVKKKGDEFVGAYEGGEVGKCKVSDLAVKDGVFTFTVNGKLDDNEFVAKFGTKPEGDEVEGEMELAVSGETMNTSFTGKREKPASLVGTWDLLIEAGEENHHPKMVVAEKDGKFTATFGNDDVGEFEAKNLKVDGGQFSFNMDGELQGEDFEALCKGEADGNELEGELKLTIGGETMDLPMTGKLQK